MSNRRAELDQRPQLLGDEHAAHAGAEQPARHARYLDGADAIVSVREAERAEHHPLRRDDAADRDGAVARAERERETGLALGRRRLREQRQGGEKEKKKRGSAESHPPMLPLELSLRFEQGREA